MAPKLSFHGQPLGAPHAAGSFLRSAIAADDAQSLSIAVAWARFRGLIRLADELRGFRERGGKSSLIVGIDEGVATRPGLALALSLFDEVVLFHDRGGRTFHPKLYLVEGSSVSSLFIGSSNLTGAGLYFNFEASLQADFPLPEDEGHEALSGVRAYFDALRGDAAAVPLDPETLDLLAADPRWRIGASEKRTRRKGAADPVDPDEVEGQADPDAGPFARSSSAETFPPPLSDAARALLGELEGTPTGATDPAEEEAPPGEEPSKAVAWSKVLSSTDAQHPPQPDSNPTGNLRLSNARNPIDHLTWFRHELFAGEDWVVGADSRGNPLETAVVPVEVEIDGASLGTIDMRVDHAPHREEGQSNVPTVLHWGSTLGPIMRATNRSDAVVTIERGETGSYRLTIA